MNKNLIITLLLLLPFCAFTQNEDSIFIRKIADDVLVNGKAYENLYYLTKKIGGRLTASPQTYLAEAWGKRALQAAGADSVYEQTCTVKHWVRGGKDNATVYDVDGKLYNWPLSVVALGNSQGTGQHGVQAEVIAVSSFDELEKRKTEVKGKVVMYNYSFNDTYITPGQAYGESGKYRYIGASRAAKYGAVATIVRSLTNATDNFPHTGAMAYNDSFPHIPALAIGIQDADSLYALCQTHKRVRVQLVSYGHFLPDTIAHNIIGEMKGSDYADEYITLGGHLDSWDLAEGAHDDGAGIVHTIEVLRTLKALGYKPKHTIRFVLFANEENGLRGGVAYANNAKEKNEKHVMAIESDEGGFTPRGFSFETDDTTFYKLLKWKPLFEPYFGSTFTRNGGGADISPLFQQFKTPMAGFNPDNQRYFDVHHAKTDTFESVNKRELHLGAVNIAALIYLVDKYGL